MNVVMDEIGFGDRRPSYGDRRPSYGAGILPGGAPDVVVMFSFRRGISAAMGVGDRSGVALSRYVVK